MDDDVTAAVRAFRAATTTDLDDATRRAIWRALEAKTEMPSRPRTMTIVVIAAMAIAAALVLVFGALERSGVRVGTDTSSGDQAVDAATPHDDGGIAASSVPPPPPAELQSPRPAAVPSPSRDVPPVRADSPRPSVHEDARAPIAVPPPPAIAADAARADRLRRENELLGRAKEASLAGDRAAAAALLEVHAREFPTGTLAPERWVLRIELACAANDVDAARVAAASFARAYPHAPSARELERDPCK